MAAKLLQASLKALVCNDDTDLSRLMAAMRKLVTKYERYQPAEMVALVWLALGKGQRNLWVQADFIRQFAQHRCGVGGGKFADPILFAFDTVWGGVPEAEREAVHDRDLEVHAWEGDLDRANVHFAMRMLATKRHITAQPARDLPEFEAWLEMTVFKKVFSPRFWEDLEQRLGALAGRK